MLSAFIFYCSCGPTPTPEAESDHFYRQALEHFHAGQWKAAAEQLQRCLQLAPDSTAARVRLGEIYLVMGQSQLAEQTLADLPPAAGNLPQAHLLRARLLTRQGRTLEAKAITDDLLQRDPQSLDARLHLARLSQQSSATMNLERSRQLCEGLLREFPHHREASILLLRARLRQGELSHALDFGRQLMQRLPQDRLVHLLAGTAALWAGDDAAVPILQQAVDLSSQHFDRLKALWLLKLHYNQRGGYPAALSGRYRFHTFRPPLSESHLRFTDIAVESGVDKTDRGRGSAWLDFDDDGDFDLFSVGIQAVHALYRNDGGGNFADVTKEKGLDDRRGGWGASSVDYDNDGDPDLFVSRDAWEGRAANSLYRNDGDRFVDIAPQAGVADSGASFTATWGDYNNDSYLDLYVANGVIGDGDTNRLYRNNGDGTFAEMGTAAAVADSGNTIGTAFGDYDNDGRPDLYVVNIGQPNRLYRNNGDGTFADRALAAGVSYPLDGGYVTFFFDYNNDGQLDIFAALMSSFNDALNSAIEGQAVEPNRPFLYHNNGDGTFADITQLAGLARSFGTMGIGMGDIDNDGFADIYLANGGPEMYRLEPNTLFRNRGDGTFADVTELANVGNLGKGHGATFADFDRDGDLDLYAGLGGHYNGDVWPNSLYRNDGTNGYYLQVELQGTRSNRDAIGARLTLYSGAHRVHTQVASGFGFGSNNALTTHLGLGTQRHIDRLEVHWPSGLKQQWQNVAPNQAIRIIEGQADYTALK